MTLNSGRHTSLRHFLMTLALLAGLVWGCSKSVDPTPPAIPKVTLVVWYDRNNYVDTTQGYFTMFDSTAIVRWGTDSVVIARSESVTLRVNQGSSASASFGVHDRHMMGGRLVDTTYQYSRSIDVNSNTVWHL